MYAIRQGHGEDSNQTEMLRSKLRSDQVDYREAGKSLKGEVGESVNKENQVAI